MPTVKTVKLKAYTTRAGYAQADAVLEDLRLLYNGALEERRTAYRQAGVSLDRNHQSKELTAIRKTDPAFDAVTRRLQVEVLDRLHLAFAAFFRRVKAGEKPGYPRFKGRRHFKTLASRYVEPAWYKFNGQEVKLAVKGLPVLTAPAGGRTIPEGKPLSMRLTRRGRSLWLSLTYEWTPDPQPFTGAVVGLDRGITALAADSNGRQYPPVQTDRRKRRRLQRIMARRMPPRGRKGSKRYHQAKANHARLLERQKTAGVNHLHRLSSAIVRDHDIMVVEALRIRNMTASAKGTTEAPGKNVQAKAGLNRSILEQRWGVLLHQLQYKAEWAGKKVVEVPPAFTSQICSACGVVCPANRRGKRYTCSTCGVAMDADVNAAVNILRRGLTALGLEPCPTGAQDGQQLHGHRGNLGPESPG